MKPGDRIARRADTDPGKSPSNRANWPAVLLVGLLAALVLCTGTLGTSVAPVAADTDTAVRTVEYAADAGNGSISVASEDQEEPTCNRCHNHLEPNPRERPLSNEVNTQPDHAFEFDHGPDMWCLDCHARADRNRLRLANGSVVRWTPTTEIQQCGSCHGPVYSDWRAGIHGSWNGSWADPNPADTCTDCHDPHEPGTMSIQPEPAPQEPPPGPEVARAVLPGGYYVAVGFLGVIAAGLVGFASLALRGDHDG